MRTPVVILCGGRGTRLQEHTQDIPKPLGSAEVTGFHKDAVALNDLWASGEAPWRVWA
jgi:hypothetical protein